jgi:mono/diheme cytochrome c family protein/glucose/arabinose dehydrogenase
MISLQRSFALLAVNAALLLPFTAQAQSGDRAGEVQTPPKLTSPPAPPLSADEALRTFRLPPGFRIEIVAAEPLVLDPVAMSFGADGRLWVVEMRGFMNDVDGRNENAPIGIIAVLEDTDGDGRMDKRTQFADGLVMPRAVAPVANGALVAEPPHLWFYVDEDGDGKADSRKPVADDYGDRSNPEHTANGLMWAMDNWIYSANHQTRFRFLAGEWRREPTAFRGQWGITQDDHGRLYYNSNSDPLRTDVLPAEYLRRNPNLLTPSGVNVQLAPPQSTPVWPGRITLGVNRGYRVLRDDGTLPSVTAACGPVIYRGTAFPAEFRGNAFIAEPAANLVKRLIVDPHSPVPSARNAYERSEFLTSTDERFRPVNLHNGPDGALYVVDMYRGVIQHRIYLTTYLRRQIQSRGLEAPVGQGRIYRIVAQGASRYRKPKLATAATSRLVSTLAHREAWYRDTAQRLLVERRDQKAVPPLRQLARNARSSLARLHALWTLEGLDGVDWDTVRFALDDPDVEVAIAAARLAEPFLAREPDRAVVALMARAKWGEARFLRQLALSLGAGPAHVVDEPLARLAADAGHLPYVADAVASSLVGREHVVLERLIAFDASNAGGARSLAASLSAVILQSQDAARITQLWNRLNEAGTPVWWCDAVLDGLARFSRGRGSRPRTVFLPAEPTALISFSRGKTTQAERARVALRSVRWRGQDVDAGTLTAMSEAERRRYERGSREFLVCAACHQPDGQGMAGVAPPLAGSPWVTGGVGALARIVLNGKTSGETAMPPLASLDDATIAAILTYVRKSWGNDAAPVADDEIRAIRNEVAQRQEPWTETQLEPMN